MSSADHIQNSVEIPGELLVVMLLLTFQVRDTNWLQSGQDPL